MKTPVKTRCSALHVAPDVTLYHVGPPLDLGPLPTLFYFAISGPDSLTLDPFNQPVQFLQGKMIRVFSMTLPAHENDLPAKDAMRVWAEEMERGIDRVRPFLEDVQKGIDFAVREKFVTPEKMAISGLSRGAFIAAHVAAIDPRFRSIVGFAPLTALRMIREFRDMQENATANGLDLVHLASALSDRQIKLFIGNDDTRVGTRECFEFVMALTKEKKGKIVRAELEIYPSIGHMGHGTPPEIFKKGADWLVASGL